MDRRKFSVSMLLAAGQWSRGLGAWARNEEGAVTQLPNAPTPTLGGKQFWGDELFFHDWHIQRNAITGHCRLLSGDSRRRAWGTFAQCLTRLQQIKGERNLSAMSGRCVILLHGLVRSSSSMKGMAHFLAAEGHYNTFNVSYPTTRADIGAHARALASIVQNLDGIEEINFVAHSLGNLVIRHYLADRLKEAGAPDARIKRIVMLGPPNQGARLAEVLGRNVAFDVLVGKSGTQLARHWSTLETQLATPECEFAIIAGGRGGATGYNPLLAGDNDLIVSVESTRLCGAADFAVLPALHTVMMDDGKVQEYTLRFLQSGCFIAPDRRQPIAMIDKIDSPLGA